MIQATEKYGYSPQSLCKDGFVLKPKSGEENTKEIGQNYNINPLLKKDANS